MVPNKDITLLHSEARPPALARDCGRSRGLTLIELLVVLADHGARHRRSRFRSSRARRTPRCAAPRASSRRGLRLARSEAVSQRRETFLVIDLAGRRFKVDQDAQEYPLPRNVELKLFTAQKDLVDDKVGSIRFYPDGGSNGGRITLGTGDRKYEVDVDWLTGRVAILD